jgi:hypothetical protein
MRGQSRRELLQGSLGLLAGAIGIGAAVAPASAAPPDATTLRLAGLDVFAKVHGRPSGRRPQPSDQLHLHGRVTDHTGAVAGSFTAAGLAVRTPSDDGMAIVEQHVFVLGDGTITGAGQRTGDSGTFAVTGGTGRYGGARGSYTATVDPVGLGGNGSAHFDFVLST